MASAEQIDDRITELEAEIAKSTADFAASQPLESHRRSRFDRDAHEQDQARRRGGLDELGAIRSRL